MPNPSPALGTLTGILGAAAALSVIFWLGYHWPWGDEAQRKLREQQQRELSLSIARESAAADRDSDQSKKPNSASARAESTPQAPLPKVEVKEPTFDLGRIKIGVGQSHLFRIKNVGQAPLAVWRLPVTDESTDRGIKVNVAPGQTADIEMRIVPRHLRERSFQIMVLQTNDPKTPQIILKLTADVVAENVPSSPAKVP